MKNTILGLAALVSFSACQERTSTKIENPTFRNIFNDGTMAVHGENKNRPQTFIRPEEMNFQYHNPAPYPANRPHLPYLEITDGSPTLHLFYDQGLVVGDLESLQ